MIRCATEEDFEQILDMSAEFWKSTQFIEPFERDHTINMIEMAYDHGLLAVVEIDNKCVGFCAAVKSFILGSTKAMCATELAYYIYPEHRGGKNGVALLQFMEKLVKEQNIKYWTMATMESSMPIAVGKMYEKMGYVRSETCYTKVFSNGSDNSSSSSRVSSSLLSK